MERRKTVDQAVEQAAQHKLSRHLSPVFAAAAVGLSLMALWLLYRSLQGQGGIVFAVLATVAAMGSTWQAIFDFETGRQNPTATFSAHFMTASAAFGLLLAEWLMARLFYSLFWLTPVVLAGAAFLSYHLGRQFKS
jgi:hypothetical protein